MNDEMEKRLLRDLMFILPVFIIFALGYLPMSVHMMNIWVACFIVSTGLAVPFYIDLLWLARGKRFLPEAKPRNLQQNQGGIVWVWITAALTLGFVAFVWWVVSYPLFMIIDVYSQTFTTPDEIAPLLSLITRVIVWFLGIVVFGVIIWAIVSSYQGERQSYPGGLGPYFGG